MLRKYFSNECMSLASIFIWYKMFKGRKNLEKTSSRSVENQSHVNSILRLL